MNDKELNELFCKTSTYQEKYNFRSGHALMEALFTVRNDLYQKITGSLIDPYYSEDNVDNCLIYLMEENENWLSN